ncbi:Clavaminate synthase-like protein [Coccomyxa subellipsoidea C-169]|uniref:Clavaminate synthase-like protein n=1 Tax=Coccomyxa subellipsoidea (strain C-169) TaxID=574566 RepID=I0YLS8_COCSC|nr:Clavaminate synthase-like protein [Coccomyxa subellipsoidea C-169]EIE19347.1 Clavaminate synthase-like protein [Coccomyxa subellipsoidea C-169]|eukprot:XP_005643891.1 Clavaminate synthase-like protein [Coccomyxa subellipsoidea C-169]
MPARLSIVDLSDIEARKQDISRQLLEAATGSGFFYVTGHGISKEEVEEQFANGRRFIDLHEATKAPTKFVPDLFMGWRGRQDTNAAVGNDSWEQYLVGVNDHYMDAHNLWQPERILPGFRTSALAFAAKANAVAASILSCFEEALKLPAGFFQEHLDLQASDARTLFGWNYYPAPKPGSGQARQLRLLPHADTDVITLLFQRPGEPGLEILPGKDADAHAADDPSGKDATRLNGAWTGGLPRGIWTRMDPLEGAITVNIGNMLMRLSDGLLLSTYHRVRAPLPEEQPADRNTMVLFVHGRGHAVMQGPRKVYPAQTVAEMIAANGNGYEKVKQDKEWQQQAMTFLPHTSSRPAAIEAV